MPHWVWKSEWGRDASRELRGWEGNAVMQVPIVLTDPGAAVHIGSLAR